MGVETKPVLALEGKMSLNYTQTGLRTLAAQDTLSASDSLWTTAVATDPSPRAEDLDGHEPRCAALAA